MPSISLTNPENITNLTLGTSSEAKLGGNIDLSKFTRLKQFRARGLDLNSVVGFENLSELAVLNVQENILSDDPLPTLVNTSISRINISGAVESIKLTGPSTVADGWTIPSTMQQFRADSTNLRGAKLDILTAFYDVFKDVDPLVDYDGFRVLSVANSGGRDYDDNTSLTGDYTGTTVLQAKAKLAAIGFTLYGF